MNLGEWNRAKRQKEIQEIRKKARAEIQSMTPDQFFVAGVMLYWAEGSKGGTEVRVSNSDPMFVQFMMKWFRECAHVPESKFRASVHYHEGQDELSIRKYWSRIMRIPLDHFYKSFCKPPGTGHRTHVLHYGTVQIRICDADLRQRIVGWHEALIEDIISGTE